jgi:hypothetical protein
MKRFLIAGIAGFIAVLSWDARAHEAHRGIQYEMHCCNQQDCKPVKDEIVTETSAGFELHDIPEFVERTSPKVRKPINEEYHVCRNPAGALLCIYPKLQGM